MNHKAFPSKHWVNAYLLSLITMAWVLLGIGGVIYVSCIYDPSIASNASERPVKLLIYFVPCLIFALFCAARSYEIFGRVTIYEDRLVLAAPFRRKTIYPVNEIKHIQIDYSLLSVSKQFWVILGTQPLPAGYLHKINEMPITSARLKLQYTPELDAHLEKLLTGRLYREYSRAKSALRTHDVR